LWDSQVVSASQGRQQQALEASQSFADKKVNGVIFAPIERVENADTINAEIVAKLQIAGIPIVLADREYLPFPARSCYDLISLDNFETTFALTQHLINHQCERLYFVYRQYSAYSVNMRIAAFREALIANNLEFSSQNIICEHPEDESIMKQFDIIPGKTGIICANDSTAASLLLNFKNQKIGVPETVRFAAFDDMKYAAHLYSPLTSVQQPARAIAQSLVGLLLERILNPQLSPRQVLHSGKIIIRESSGNI
jgi:GntR family transcriptional regulator of arabinose operon